MPNTSQEPARKNQYWSQIALFFFPIVIVSYERSAGSMTSLFLSRSDVLKCALTYPSVLCEVFGPIGRNSSVRHIPRKTRIVRPSIVRKEYSI